MNTQTLKLQSVYLALRYNDAKAAIAWLTSVLGFEEHEVCPADDGTIAHAELQIDGNLIMLGNVKNDSYGKSPKTLGGTTGAIYIALATPEEIDARYARAKAAGAEILRELADTEYGSHDFAVRDPEGQIWSFGTYRPQAG
jgi:uncharacterized glyoxalase superfamily protein PhnB